MLCHTAAPDSNTAAAEQQQSNANTQNTEHQADSTAPLPRYPARHRTAQCSTAQRDGVSRGEHATTHAGARGRRCSSLRLAPYSLLGRMLLACLTARGQPQWALLTEAQQMFTAGRWLGQSA